MGTPASPDAVPARCIALAGPTASGKTAAALAIARHHPLEIISVDSALVYRGMDIGTAKPSHAELAAVPHHLIDIRDPLQAYSAAEFVADAQRLVGEINARGRLALLVGGTMLYFKALFEGLDPMPPADPAIRAALEAEAAKRGWPAMHAELARIDPATAARLPPADSQRIQRALEVFRVSGQPLSSFHATKKRAPEDQGTRTPTLISLEPQDRAWLHARIAQRFDAMLTAGFLAEMQALRARGDLSPELPSMRCVGYRQAWEVMDAHDARGMDAHSARGLDRPALAELRDKGIFATRQLAKRQLTWLRAMPGRQVVACDAHDALPQVLHRVARLLAQK
ncbi:tRNA (adenosine(37)-N6)-dimethylallyltransferase MiaA [Variovorax terrae]|uniref:tRNA dimethylallyltransferase n=1 Tax=Variovorax terrae TaxID=2923278 RepID=A0A9X1VSJ5_9BURK|nr:tRNA (adenosine(37)-N6)-dimethylallyltransferase MiaA [Variovorax terrae]MCJ0762595.1 tRNA (adenosine(37)-N6)-dimethylallyltransferase MiaA [Variovorax terrae]